MCRRDETVRTSFSALERGVFFAAMTLIFQPVSASRYRDNPGRVVDRKSETWTSPIGRLETIRTVTYRGDVGTSKGTAFLVSPCYIASVIHVVVPDSGWLRPGIDYAMTFRAGYWGASAFAGHTTVHPQFETAQKVNGAEMILLKTADDKCLGALPNFGWLEPARSKLVRGMHVIALGYPGDRPEGEMHLSRGEVRASTYGSKHLFTGSFVEGESGGAELIVEDGRLKVIGATVSQLDAGRIGEYETYADNHGNEIQGASDYLNSPKIKALLDADKARFGKPNPALQRQTMTLLPQ